MDNSQNPQFKHPEFKYRGHINEDLAGRYGWLISNLEKIVKDDAATAHRTATQLRRTCERFENALSDEQKLSLKAAASSMGRLARELDELKPWAKSKVSYQKAKMEAQKKFDEEVFAVERWSGDAKAMLVEYAHAEAFVAEEGETWLTERYQTSRALVPDRNGGQFNCLNSQSTTAQIQAALVKFLLELKHLLSETDSRTNGRGEVITTRWAGWNDYSLFLSARTGAAASACAVLDRLVAVEGGAL